jgi:hypothetical protein
MPKTIATDWKVVINGVVLSDHCFDVQIGDEKEQIDVSGFNPLGAREYLPGTQDQTITLQFLNDWASGSVHATLNPLYTGGSTFPIFVQPDSDAGTSATNPIYGGSANIYSYPPGATLNERVELTVEFKPAPNSKFTWGTVAP